MKRGAALITALAWAALYLAPGAQAFECGTVLDTFTRASGTNLGAKWTEHAPDPAIEAQGFTVAAEQPGLATFNGVTATEACADVTSTIGLSYAAIAIRYGGLTNNVFVKVQGSGPFTQVWFYKGNNGSAWNLGQSPHPVPAFSSARLHVAVSGTTVTAEIDTNFNNKPEVTIVEQNLPTAGLGALVGLGSYGHSRIDNFAIPKAQAPSSFSCAGLAATLVGTDARDTITGTSGRDVIAALGDNDLVRGLAGKDALCGGDGKDKLIGGKGKDRLFGEGGKDKLVGGPKSDQCNGGPGKDSAKSC